MLYCLSILIHPLEHFWSFLYWWNMLWVSNIWALESLIGADEPSWRKRAVKALGKHPITFYLSFYTNNNAERIVKNYSKKTYYWWYLCRKWSWFTSLQYYRNIRRLFQCQSLYHSGIQGENIWKFIMKRWQWCWWQRYLGDFMMLTDLRCWWQNHYVGDFVSNIRHQHRCHLWNSSNCASEPIETGYKAF